MKLEVVSVSKVYGTQKALDDISFTLNPGEIVGFLGPNGAGKSTTLKIISGFIPPTSGTVRLDELNILEHSLAIRKRLGYLPEHNPLYLDMYVHEFLRFTGKLYKVANLTQRIKEIIELTGLGIEQHKKIGMLSKGYRQRVGLAQALIHNPDVLLLDEPTSHLDPIQVMEIRKVIKDAGASKILLFSSHILSEVEAIADRVLIINFGKILADTTIKELGKVVSTESILLVEFEKAGFDASAIAATEGVLAVEQKDATHFEFRVSQNIDVRKAINDACVAQQNSILSMNKAESNLEELFRRITQNANNPSV